MSIVVPLWRYSVSTFASRRRSRNNAHRESRYFNSVGNSRGCHSRTNLVTLSNADMNCLRAPDSTTDGTMSGCGGRATLISGRCARCQSKLGETPLLVTQSELHACIVETCGVPIHLN